MDIQQKRIRLTDCNNENLFNPKVEINPSNRPSNDPYVSVSPYCRVNSIVG